MTKILTDFSFSTPLASPFSSQSYQRSITSSSSNCSFSPKSTAPTFLPPPECPPTATSSLRSEEHTSELQSLAYLVCRLLLEKKKKKKKKKKKYKTKKKKKTTHIY